MPPEDAAFTAPDHSTFGSVTYRAPPDAYVDDTGQRHYHAIVSWPGHMRFGSGGKPVDEPVAWRQHLRARQLVLRSGGRAILAPAIPVNTFGTLIKRCAGEGDPSDQGFLEQPARVLAIAGHQRVAPHRADLVPHDA